MTNCLPQMAGPGWQTGWRGYTKALRSGGNGADPCLTLQRQWSIQVLLEGILPTSGPEGTLQLREVCFPSYGQAPVNKLPA